MKKFISNKYVLYIAGIVLIFAIWFILSVTIDVENMIVPSPIDTFAEMGNLLTKSYTYKCLGFTLQRVFLSFVISFILALVFGLISGNSEKINSLFKPILTLLKSIPTVALVFLFAVLVGAKDAAVLVTIMVSFPILYEAISNGIKNTDENMLQAAKVDGTGVIKQNLCIRLPLAVPYIVVGIFSSFSLSFKVEIMAEVISGSTNYGLGSAIKGALTADATNSVTIFAYCLISVIIVFIISIISVVGKELLKRKYDF